MRVPYPTEIPARVPASQICNSDLDIISINSALATSTIAAAIMVRRRGQGNRRRNRGNQDNQVAQSILQDENSLLNRFHPPGQESHDSTGPQFADDQRIEIDMELAVRLELARRQGLDWEAMLEQALVQQMTGAPAMDPANHRICHTVYQMPESQNTTVPKTSSFSFASAFASAFASSSSSSSGSLSRTGKSFLDLPYDVRLPIYRELLKSKTGILYRICPSTLRLLSPVTNVEESPFLEHGLAPAILATCRQINNEATRILYHENEFPVADTCHVHGACHTWALSERAIGAISAIKLQHINPVRPAGFSITQKLALFPRVRTVVFSCTPQEGDVETMLEAHGPALFALEGVVMGFSWVEQDPVWHRAQTHAVRHEDQDEGKYLDLKFAQPLLEYNRRHGHGKQVARHLMDFRQNPEEGQGYSLSLLISIS